MYTRELLFAVFEYLLQKHPMCYWTRKNAYQIGFPTKQISANCNNMYEEYVSFIDLQTRDQKIQQILLKMR